MLAAIVMTAAVLLGTGLGAVVPPTGLPLDPLLSAAIVVQVVLSVGGLRAGWFRDRVAQRRGVHLLVLHHAIATAPWVLVWAIVLLAGGPASHPLFLGLVTIALMPPSAGLPAYAAAARVDPEEMTVFASLSYLIAPVVSPLLVILVLGTQADPGAVAITAVTGLILPCALGIVAGPLVRRIPGGVRTGVIVCCMFLTTFVFGQSLGDIDFAGVGWWLLVAGLGMGVGRCLLGLAAGRGVAAVRSAKPFPLMLAGALKNDALAAAVVLPVLGGLAVLPALGSIVASMAAITVVAARGRGRAAVPGPHPDSAAERSQLAPPVP